MVGSALRREVAVGLGEESGLPESRGPHDQRAMGRAERILGGHPQQQPAADQLVRRENRRPESATRRPGAVSWQ